MIKKSRFFYVFLLLSFLFSNSVLAQDNKNVIPLVQVLESIQKQFDIQFNYEKDVVDPIRVIAPSTELSLDEILNYLQKKTSLNFERLGQFILISVKDLTLCGYIKDNVDERPLSLATIQTENTSAISDDNGYFQISVAHKDEVITIRHLGYITQQTTYLELYSSECKDVQLVPNFQSLSEVVISGYITKGINKINNGSFDIDFTEFDILPGLVDTDVLQSVQAFPGIQSSNETVSNINIRGGSHDQNLILWDNIKMYQSGHFFGLISMYNPQITQHVTLVKNGTDVTLTDGVSGTISMTTEKELNTSFKGSLGINFIDANGFADIPLSSKSSIQVAARKSISDFIKTPTYTKFFDRISQDTEVENNTNSIINSDKEFDFYDASFRWIYKVSDKDEIRLNFITVTNELIFNENAMIENEHESRQSRLSQNSIAGGLYYNRIWNDKWQTTLEIYETDYKLKAINANILDEQRFLQENIISETSAKVIANYKINDRFHVLNGYHFVETEITNLDDVDNPIFRLLVSEVVRTHGVFSELKFISKDRKTNVLGGLRYSYVDKFKKHILEPRFSFSHKLLDNLTLEVLGEFKHQNTSQVINFQNDFLGIEKRRWQLSNDAEIPILRSKQASIGLHFSKGGWLLSAEAYLKDVKGITTQSQGFQNQYEFVKTDGRYKTTGVDVLVRKKLDDFNTWLSYAYMNNRYTFNSLPEIEFPSNYDITHAITFGTSYSFNKLKISAGFNWHSGKPITLPISGNEIVDNDVNFGSTNANKLKDYFRMDVSALYDFNLGKSTKAKAGISLWNVLDRENQINRFFGISNDDINQTTQTSLGFTPNVVLRVYFD